MLQSSYRLPTKNLEVKDYTLVCASGPHKGLRLRLEQEFLCVGRERWCDIALTDDRRISREHCLLQLTDEGIRVRNLKPKNSVFLGDIRIHDAYMTPGQRLLLGETELALQLRGTTRRLSLALHDASGQLVGQCEEMRRLFALMQQLGPLDVPLLLTGAVGVGKRAVATALHHQSHRASGPLVMVDLTQLSPHWMEAYLFGYEAGVYPEAPERYCGYLEQAYGGTLALHEITSLPLELQSRLLEVFVRKSFFRIGGTEPLPLELRLISTSSHDLDWAVSERFFLSELLKALGICSWELPSLEQRREDIPVLVEHLLWQLCPERTFHLTPKALRGLSRITWSEHIAGLRALLGRCVERVQGAYIDQVDLERAAV